MYSLTSERRIPYRKRGNKLYFFKKELVEWIQSGGAYDKPYTLSEQEQAEFDAHLEELREKKRHSAKAMLAYLFYHLSFYHIRAFISSQYVRWTLRAILFSVWLMCSRTRKWRTGNGEEPHRYAY